jgi:hypothetical protein
MTNGTRNGFDKNQFCCKQVAGQLLGMELEKDLVQNSGVMQSMYSRALPHSRASVVNRPVKSHAAKRDAEGMAHSLPSAHNLESSCELPGDLTNLENGLCNQPGKWIMLADFFSG